MERAFHYLCIVLVVFCSGALFACSRCSGDSEILARLEAKQGKVERDFAAKPSSFEPAPLEASFHDGDAARTDAGARATLRLSDGSALALDPLTVVRFLEHPPGENAQRLKIEMGGATLETGAKAMSLETEVGQATIAAKSRVRLSATAGGVRFEIDIGAAQFRTAGGTLDLAAGGQLELAQGGKEVPLAPTGSSRAAASAAVQPAGPEGEGTSSGTTVLLEGPGGSSRAPSAKRFVDLPVGKSTLAPGTVLRLDAQTTAIVKRGDQSARLEGPGEFVVGDSEWLVGPTSGSVAVSHAENPLRIPVPGGTITVQAGSEATVRLRGSNATLSVRGGSAVVQGKAETRTFKSGEEAVLDAQGRINVTRGRGPEIADLLIQSGESWILHDPKPPTAVGIGISGKCPGGGIVEMTSRASTSSVGEGTVNVLAAAGSNKYRLRCLTKGQEPSAVVSEGVLTVLHDAGTRQLARTAPMTSVDTDGRNYTVLYQTLMPKLQVRWPNAPKSDSYRLEVSLAGGKKQVVSGATPTHTFAPGSLAEGIHQLQYQAGNGAKSKITSIGIRFDNAAPTASLSSPAAAGFAAGAPVQVSGTALPGWTVSVGDLELPQDEQHRFSGTVPAPSGARALVIRFAHPQRGVHSYLRRPAGGGS